MNTTDIVPVQPEPEPPEITGGDVAKLMLWLGTLTDKQVEMVEMQAKHELERRRSWLKKGVRK
jgi:hypothetical protein